MAISLRRPAVAPTTSELFLLPRQENNSFRLPGHASQDGGDLQALRTSNSEHPLQFEPNFPKGTRSYRGSLKNKVVVVVKTL